MSSYKQASGTVILSKEDKHLFIQLEPNIKLYTLNINTIPEEAIIEVLINEEWVMGKIHQLPNGVYKYKAYVGEWIPGHIFKSSTEYISGDLPDGDIMGCSFSPDGAYLAITQASMLTPYVLIYKRDKGVYRKLPESNITIPSLKGAYPRDCKFSPDNKILFVALGGTSPFLITYKIDEGNFIEVNIINNVPSWVQSCSFSSDSKYLAITHLTEPYISIYKKNGEMYDKLPNPSRLPSYGTTKCNFSTDSVYLAVGQSNYPYFNIYKRDSDQFTKLTNPSISSTSEVRDCKFSPNGNLLAIIIDRSPHILLYRRENDSFIRLDDPDVIPSISAYDCSFSPDGNYLSVGDILYKINGDRLDVLNKLDKMEERVLFTPDSKYLFGGTKSNIIIYNKVEYVPEVIIEDEDVDLNLNLY